MCTLLLSCLANAVTVWHLAIVPAMPSKISVPSIVASFVGLFPGGASHNYSILSSGLSRALCYSNRHFKHKVAGHCCARLLCISSCDDDPNQYISVMNAIFSAQVLEIVQLHLCFHSWQQKENAWQFHALQMYHQIALSLTLISLDWIVFARSVAMSALIAVILVMENRSSCSKLCIWPMVSIYIHHPQMKCSSICW